MATRYFYSASVHGFFTDDVHGDKMPADAAQITAERWQELLSAQSTGHRIVASSTGPIAVEHSVTAEQRRADLRAQRDAALAATDGVVNRHRDEVDLSARTTLSARQYAALLAYRKALRNLPQQPSFPDINLPQPPELD